MTGGDASGDFERDSAHRPEPRAEDGPFGRPEVVRTYEDWYATPFGHLADELETAALVERLDPLPSKARVLEIGCGTGHFAGKIAERLRPEGRVFGIDASAPMLDLAKTRVPVAVADAARLPFRDAAFEASYLIALLDFVPDPLLVLREARRVSRSHVVVLALVSHSWLAFRRRVSGRRGHPIFRTARFFSRRRLLDLARSAGAEPRDVRQFLALPPGCAGRLAGLERRLARADLRIGGLLAFRLDA